MNEENRDIWQEVLDGVREIKSGGGKRFTVEAPMVVDARHQVGFSQVKLILDMFLNKKLDQK